MVREQRGQVLQQARQLQEETERFGSKGGGGSVRGEVKLTAKLSSKMQERLKAERTKLEEQLRQESRRRAHEELVWVRHGMRRVLER